MPAAVQRNAIAAFRPDGAGAIELLRSPGSYRDHSRDTPFGILAYRLGHMYTLE
jgi:hypothetical protein